MWYTFCTLTCKRAYPIFYFISSSSCFSTYSLPPSLPHTLPKTYLNPNLFSFLASFLLNELLHLVDLFGGRDFEACSAKYTHADYTRMQVEPLSHKPFRLLIRTCLSTSSSESAMVLFFTRHELTTIFPSWSNSKMCSRSGHVTCTNIIIIHSHLTST